MSKRERYMDARVTKFILIGELYYLK